jgi:hypothetical protein
VLLQPMPTADWFLIQDEGPAILPVDRLTVQDWKWVRG